MVHIQVFCIFDDSGDGAIDLSQNCNVQDIVGAMFSSNTETGISATYEDGDGTIDLVTSISGTQTIIRRVRSLRQKEFKMWLVEWYHLTQKVVSQ